MNCFTFFLVSNSKTESSIEETPIRSSGPGAGGASTNANTNYSNYGSLSVEVTESALEDALERIASGEAGLNLGSFTATGIGGGANEEEENPCGTGFVQDRNGNCVEKPCPGDPVANPQIAPQASSGIPGGIFGTCTRDYEYDVCAPKKRKHQGVDILNKENQPIFAMFDGIARLQEQDGGAGHHTSITSTVNGKTVRHVYFHLQDQNRVSGPVKAGDIIGYQGVSGNLAGAIRKGYSQSHVHVKLEENGTKKDPLKYFNTKIDPKTGAVTTPCKN